MATYGYDQDPHRSSPSNASAQPLPQTSAPMMPYSNAHQQAAPTAVPITISSECEPLDASKKMPLILSAGVQLVLGVLMFAFTIPAISVAAACTQFVAPGIWGGLHVVATGVIGLVMLRSYTRGLVIAYSICSLIAAVLQVVGIIVSSIGLAVDGGDTCYSDGDQHWICVRSGSDAMLAMNGLLLIFHVGECASALYATAVGWMMVCRQSVIYGSRLPPYVMVPSYMQVHNFPYHQLYQPPAQPQHQQPQQPQQHQLHEQQQQQQQQQQLHVPQPQPQYQQ